MKKIFLLIIWVGLIAGLYYMGFFDSFITQAQIRYDNVFVPSSQSFNDANNNSQLDPSQVAKKSFSEFSEETIDKNGFYLRVDKINLFKKVIKNVDPRNKEEYVNSWNYGISHGKFTSTPDKIGITYLFSHALGEKYAAMEQNAWFSYMDQVVVGDEVIIYYEGKKYTYSVSEIKVVSPTATGFYTGAAPVSMVRMQFCGPPTGSLDARTLVDAILIDTKVI
jgi:sortase (surface protein transpeptidase)